jgi:hypothetical protein
MKIRSKMILGSVLLAVVPVIMAGAISNHIAIDSGGNALRQQVSNQLIALRDTKKPKSNPTFPPLVINWSIW